MFKIRYKGFKIAQVRHQWIILNNKLVFSFKIIFRTKLPNQSTLSFT